MYDTLLVRRAEEAEMKKKAAAKVVDPPVEAPIVPPELLETAKKAAVEARPKVDLRAKKTVRCRVCGAEGASEQSEKLCWVCRRLKISAWRDIEQQMPMSE